MTQNIISQVIQNYLNNIVRRPGHYLIASLNILRLLQTNGINGVKDLISLRLDQARQRNNYFEWIKQFDTLIKPTLIKEQIADFKLKPLISVVMPVYNPPEKWLKIAIESVRSQLYDNWELCIADDNSSNLYIKTMLEEYTKIDSRIKVIYRETNGHISAASNSAIELARGEFIALLDHDDELPNYALFKVVECINDNPDVCLIYSDEDKINQNNERYGPYFKSDWNYQLFLGQNIISHLGVYRTSIIRRIQGFQLGVEGSQDYDLALRFIEQIQPEQIKHIPYILYHWRAIEWSAALSPSEKLYPYEAARKSIRNHLSRINKQAIVSSASLHINHFHRVQYKLPKEIPLVTLIIINLSDFYTLNSCLEAIFATTSYANLEIILLFDDELNTNFLSIKEIIKNCLNPVNLILATYNKKINLGANLNQAISLATGNVFCFIDTSVEPLTKDWLTEMVSIALQDNIGMVGMKLLYENDTIAHAGLILGLRNYYSSAHHYFDRLSVGYHARLILMQEVTAIDGNCFVITKNTLLNVGSFNQNDLSQCYFDLELSLKLRQANFKNIFTPYAEASIGLRQNPCVDNIYAKYNQADFDFIKSNYADYFVKDFGFNPNLDVNFEDFRIAFPPPGLINDRSGLVVDSKFVKLSNTN